MSGRDSKKKNSVGARDKHRQIEKAHRDRMRQLMQDLAATVYTNNKSEDEIASMTRGDILLAAMECISLLRKKLAAQAGSRTAAAPMPQMGMPPHMAQHPPIGYPVGSVAPGHVHLRPPPPSSFRPRTGADMQASALAALAAGRQAMAARGVAPRVDDGVSMAMMQGGNPTYHQGFQPPPPPQQRVSGGGSAQGGSHPSHHGSHPEAQTWGAGSAGSAAHGHVGTNPFSQYTGGQAGQGRAASWEVGGLYPNPAPSLSHLSNGSGGQGLVQPSLSHLAPWPTNTGASFGGTSALGPSLSANGHTVSLNPLHGGGAGGAISDGAPPPQPHQGHGAQPGTGQWAHGPPSSTGSAGQAPPPPGVWSQPAAGAPAAGAPPSGYQTTSQVGGVVRPREQGGTLPPGSVGSNGAFRMTGAEGAQPGSKRPRTEEGRVAVALPSLGVPVAVNPSMGVAPAQAAVAASS